MSMAEAMRHTTENIIDSHNVRVKALGSLVNQVSQSLAGARKGMSIHAAGRKAMGKEQAAELARFAGDLAGSIGVKLSEFGRKLEQTAKERALGAKELKGQLRKEAETLRRSVSKTLADYHQEHAQMSAATRSRLRAFTKNMVKGVEVWTAATRVLMADCRTDLGEASKTWKNMAGAFSKAGDKKTASPVMPAAKASGAEENVPVKIHREKKTRRRDGDLGEKGKGMARWSKKFQS